MTQQPAAATAATATMTSLTSILAIPARILRRLLCRAGVHAWFEHPLPREQVMFDYGTLRLYQCARCPKTKYVRFRS